MYEDELTNGQCAKVAALNGAEHGLAILAPSRHDASVERVLHALEEPVLLVFVLIVVVVVFVVLGPGLVPGKQATVLIVVFVILVLIVRSRKRSKVGRLVKTLVIGIRLGARLHIVLLGPWIDRVKPPCAALALALPFVTIALHLDHGVTATAAECAHAGAEARHGLEIDIGVDVRLAPELDIEVGTSEHTAESVHLGISGFKMHGDNLGWRPVAAPLNVAVVTWVQLVPGVTPTIAALVARPLGLLRRLFVFAVHLYAGVDVNVLELEVCACGGTRAGCCCGCRDGVGDQSGAENDRLVDGRLGHEVGTEGYR
jgi:hypothetical protein